MGPAGAQFTDVAANRAGDVAALDRLSYNGVCIFDDHQKTRFAQECRRWLVNPTGLAYNKAGKLFVCDEGGVKDGLHSSSSISVFKADISYCRIKTFGNHELSSPWSMSVTSDDKDVVDAARATLKGLYKCFLPMKRSYISHRGAILMTYNTPFFTTRSILLVLTLTLGY